MLFCKIFLTAGNFCRIVSCKMSEISMSFKNIGCMHACKHVLSALLTREHLSRADFRQFVILSYFQLSQVKLFAGEVMKFGSQKSLTLSQSIIHLFVFFADVSLKLFHLRDCSNIYTLVSWSAMVYQIDD